MEKKENLFKFTKDEQDIFSYIKELPVINTHEHFFCFNKIEADPICFILGNYYLQTDIMNALGVDENEIQNMLDIRVDYETRAQKFLDICKYINNTGYCRAAVYSIERICNIKCDGVFTRDVLDALKEYLRSRTQETTSFIFEHANIKSFIANPDVADFNNGVLNLSYPKCRVAFPLPPFHCFCSYEELRALPCVENEEDILDIDVYLEAFERYLEKSIHAGVVCIKDQSAYMRTLDFEEPCEELARKLYNNILANRESKWSQEEMQPLSDWLMCKYMEMAARYKIPVQLHTGHLAFPYSDVRKANGIQLTTLFKMHPNVRFVIFHGNWPYMGEALFLAKNYPNVYLDLCWVQSIDPLYSIEMMKRIVLTIPWNKVSVFGGDTSIPEWSVGYLELTKNNLARALEDLIEDEYLTKSQAYNIAMAWLYGNPNELYNLKLSFDSKA